MNRTLLAVLRLTLGLLVFGAIGQQLKIHVALQYDALNFFSYFTNLSNLLAAGVLVSGAMRSFKGKPPSPLFDQLRFMSVVNMTIVGIVFAVLLRNVDLGSLLPWVNTLLHYVMPIAVLIDWFIDAPQLQLAGRHLLRVLIVPTAYLAYVVIRGSLNGWYPYPFLNPTNVGGFGGVSVYALGITAMFVLSGWVLMKGANRNASSL